MLRPIAQSLHRVGGDPRAFLSALGAGEDADVDAFVPGSRVLEALERLSKAPGGQGIALTLAQASPMGSLGFFDYLFVASSNLREALARTVRFYGLVTQRVSLELEVQGGSVRVFHRLHPDVRSVPLLTEFAFAVFVLRAREAVGQAFRVENVRFRHDVADRRAHRAFFGVEVECGKAVDEMTFDAKALDVAFATADPTTGAFLETYASRLQAKLGSVDSFRDRVRAAIAKGLRERRCDLSSLARELALSPRTLQRQLEAHGTSHRELVGDVRRELATQLLARDDTSVVEVAYELGFTEQAAFHRAFVRWTGMTPGAFRSGRSPTTRSSR